MEKRPFCRPLFKSILPQRIVPSPLGYRSGERRIAYLHGKALNMASVQEIDDVIDPVETRAWLMRGLRSIPPPPPRTGKKRPCVDAW